MPNRVDQLEIGEDLIRGLAECVHRFRFGIQAGFDVGSDSALPAAFEHREREVRAHHAFPAGECYAAVRAVKRFVELDFAEGFGHAHLPRVKAHGSRGAGFDAVAAARAGVLVDNRAPLVPADRAFFAGGDARAAPRADVPCVPNANLRRNPFRILAPGAPQRTAFEKKGRPDAVAVVDGEALDIEDIRGDHSSVNSVRAMISRCRSGASSVKYAVYPATRMVRLR